MATMQDDVGIFRDDANLTAAVANLDAFQRRAAGLHSPSRGTAFNPGWHLCYDVRNMLIVSQAVAHAALMRHESRGAHSRLDYPGYDDFWGAHNIIISKGTDGSVQLEPRPVNKAPGLQELVEQRQEAERA
jgi:succinate dehydrogenase / fumarate reductase flavoprotein subunit